MLFNTFSSIEEKIFYTLLGIGFRYFRLLFSDSLGKTFDSPLYVWMLTTAKLNTGEPKGESDLKQGNAFEATIMHCLNIRETILLAFFHLFRFLIIKKRKEIPALQTWLFILHYIYSVCLLERLIVIKFDRLSTKVKNVPIHFNLQPSFWLIK